MEKNIVEVAAQIHGESYIVLCRKREENTISVEGAILLNSSRMRLDSSGNEYIRD